MDTIEKFRLEQTQFAEKVKNEKINMKQQSTATQPGTQSGYPIDVQTKIDEIEKFVPDLIIKRSDVRLLACIKNVSDVNLGNINSDMSISTGPGIDVTPTLLKIQSLLLLQTSCI